MSSDEMLQKLLEYVEPSTLLDEILYYFAEADMCECFESIASDWEIELEEVNIYA